LSTDDEIDDDRADDQGSSDDSGASDPASAAPDSAASGDAVASLGSALVRAIGPLDLPALSPAIFNIGRTISDAFASLDLARFAPTVTSLGVASSAILNLMAAADWTRSRSTDFDAIEEPPTSYSSRLSSPGDYFADQEALVGSMSDLNQVIHRLTDKAQSIPLVWRGQQNADWGLHSSLFRQLAALKGVVPPEDKPTGVQPYPSEDDMVVAERAILRVARESWRFGQMTAMETLARLQHQGAPTRLLDVTRNPYIAAWFAVEANDEHDDADARLFALGTEPMRKAPEGESTKVSHAALSSALTQSFEPFWHAFDSPEMRQKLDWGTGSNRLVWVPPEYDPRIAAQNAAFVLDGVPMFTRRVSRYFKTSDGHSWTKADLLASASIYARMYSTTRKPPYNGAHIAPSFSIRIRADAKPEIRRMLERWFGYSRATIYPDFGGLSQHITRAFRDIVGDTL